MRMLSFLLKKRTQKEFALVELVIVIAVFAIPVAIAIPVVSTILTDARSIYEQVAIDMERNNQEESALCYYLAQPSANFNKTFIDGSGRTACRINYYHGHRLKVGDANGNGVAHGILPSSRLTTSSAGITIMGIGYISPRTTTGPMRCLWAKNRGIQLERSLQAGRLFSGGLLREIHTEIKGKKARKPICLRAFWRYETKIMHNADFHILLLAERFLCKVCRRFPMRKAYSLET